MHVIQRNLLSYEHFLAEGDDNHRLIQVLDCLDAEPLLSKLNKERNRRRDSYPYRMLWNTLIAAKVYGIATIAGLARELSRNPAPREICGVRDIPKAYHYSRFLAKLAKPENQEILSEIFHGAVDALGKLLPDLGKSVAVDGTAVSSRCNRFAKDKSDKDAGWGVRKSKNSDGFDSKANCRFVLDELRGGPCSDSTYGLVLKIATSEDERRWPGLARQSKKWERLYRLRTAVERVNSRAKEHLQLDDQYVRGIGKITVNVTLSLLVMVGASLAMAKQQRWKDLRRVVRLAA